MLKRELVVNEEDNPFNHFTTTLLLFMVIKINPASFYWIIEINNFFFLCPFFSEFFLLLHPLFPLLSWMNPFCSFFSVNKCELNFNELRRIMVVEEEVEEEEGGKMWWWILINIEMQKLRNSEIEKFTNKIRGKRWKREISVRLCFSSADWRFFISMNIQSEFARISPFAERTLILYSTHRPLPHPSLHSSSLHNYLQNVVNNMEFVVLPIEKLSAVNEFRQ